jgi:hypothetical protein
LFYFIIAGESGNIWGMTPALKIGDKESDIRALFNSKNQLYGAVQRVIACAKKWGFRFLMEKEHVPNDKDFPIPDEEIQVKDN